MGSDMTLNCDNGHNLFDVGWGTQCGVCGLSWLKDETDQRLREALIKRGVKLYDAQPIDAGTFELGQTPS
jgi:hypothetical protein